MRLSDRATLLTILTLVATVIIAERCGDAPSLPPKVQAAIIRHQAQTVIDTAAVHRLERAAETERLKGLREKAASRVAEAYADSARRRADSLLVVATLARSLQESSDAYRQAEIERQRQADSLQSALDAERRATAAAEHRADSIATAIIIETTRANRADTVLAAVIPIAEGKSACRVARFFNCPSRTQVAVGGILTGVVLVAIADGKIKLRLPF